MFVVENYKSRLMPLGIFYLWNQSKDPVSAQHSWDIPIDLKPALEEPFRSLCHFSYHSQYEFLLIR